MNNQEQLLSPEHSSAEQEQTDVLDQVSEENTQSVSEQSDDTIPEKFKGKSAAEIARSAMEAERAMHERAGELSSVRRQLQETQQQISQLQSQYSSQRQQTEEIDPLEEVAKAWDEEDPKAAVLKGLKRIQETQQQKEQRMQLEMRTKEGAEYFYSQKQSNPDFAQREPEMQELAKKYGHLVRPELAGAKEVYELLHLAAQGKARPEYEKSAVEKAKKQQEAIKEEKRKAVSERSGASSTSTENALADLNAFYNMTDAQKKVELEKSTRLLSRL